MPELTRVKMTALPDCDFCKGTGETTTARYDGATLFGSWAYMCPEHFNRFGRGLGLGVGQYLYTEEES